MFTLQGPSMNRIVIEAEECKGCRLCVEFCPKTCIAIGPSFNKMGYQYAEFKSEKCTACGICYYVCPEPGAITVIEEKSTVK
jgi:NAD-dependent dihydropyrimidine dehydrogenase PreA subunit